MGSNFCVNNDHFDENLKRDLSQSRPRTFSMLYDTPVLLVECFPFPCQKAILFSEFPFMITQWGRASPRSAKTFPSVRVLFLLRFIRGGRGHLP
jgi:hypothetical protein